MALVLYRGPSAFDASVIIRAVLVADSKNAKTGAMAQLFIMHDSVAPQTAQGTGEDFSVCGLCPLRPSEQGGCYVVTCQGPLSTWKATKGQEVAGAGEVASALRKAGSLRLGAYGDPAALPASLVSYLVRLVKGRATGYTHGHLTLGLSGVEHLRRVCMLSVESAVSAAMAHARGWRTFRVTTATAPQLANEITCPSETKGTKCSDCLLCKGAAVQARSITIPAHGSRSTRALAVVQ